MEKKQRQKQVCGVSMISMSTAYTMRKDTQKPHMHSNGTYHDV